MSTLYCIQNADEFDKYIIWASNNKNNNSRYKSQYNFELIQVKKDGLVDLIDTNSSNINDKFVRFNGSFLIFDLIGENKNIRRKLHTTNKLIKEILNDYFLLVYLSLTNYSDITTADFYYNNSYVMVYNYNYGYHFNKTHFKEDNGNIITTPLQLKKSFDKFMITDDFYKNITDNYSLFKNCSHQHDYTFWEVARRVSDFGSFSEPFFTSKKIEEELPLIYDIFLKYISFANYISKIMTSYRVSLNLSSGFYISITLYDIENNVCSEFFKSRFIKSIDGFNYLNVSDFNYTIYDVFDSYIKAIATNKEKTYYTKYTDKYEIYISRLLKIKKLTGNERNIKHS